MESLAIPLATPPPFQFLPPPAAPPAPAPAPPPAPAPGPSKERHISELLPTVEIAPGVVLRPPDPALDATGLEQLIAANGGMGAMRKNLRADEQPLFQSLSQLVDDRLLKSAYTLAGVPTPGVAATIDLGEPAEAAQRLETLMCISRSKLLSNVPDDIAGPASSTTQTNLEELPADETLGAPSMLSEHLKGEGPPVVRSFTDEQVHAALVQALTGLTTSSDARVAKVSKKFLGSVVSDALRTDVGADEARAGGAAEPAPVDSISDSAVFWRAEEKKGPFHNDGMGPTYEVRLADGNGGVWKCRARDVGDSVPMNGKMRPKACVVATAVRSCGGRRRQGHAGRPLLKDLVTTAQEAAAELAPLPAAAGRSEWFVRESTHDLTKKEPHDLTAVMFDTMDPSSLAGWALKSINVSDTSILATRQTRFQNYDGRPLKYGLLLEHANAHRKFDHAVVLELSNELHSAEAFDACQVRLGTTAGTRETCGTARGWRRMVMDSCRLDI